MPNHQEHIPDFWKLGYNDSNYDRIPQKDWKSPFLCPGIPGMKSMHEDQRYRNQQPVSIITYQARHKKTGTIYTKFADGSWHYQNKDEPDGKLKSTYFRVGSEGFFSVGKMGSSEQRNYTIDYFDDFKHVEPQNDGLNYSRGINKFGDHYEKKNGRFVYPLEL